MATVLFIDTSVLCNILAVPGKDQDRDLVVKELDEFRSAGVTMILPMTSVIETGNHIAQLSSGAVRRTLAQRFSDLLSLVSGSSPPWRLHEVEWNSDFLHDLRGGGGTGVSLVEHAVSKVGVGDVCILTERQRYMKRSTLDDVKIWTRDQGLAAYS